MIQKMMFNDNHQDILIEYLERRGLDYELVRFMPFIHEIEFTTDRKDVWCWGSPNMGWAAKKYNWNPGSMYNLNHDFEIQVAHYGNNMLNAGGHIINYSDPVPSKYDEFFARPTMDSKSFKAMVYTRKQWEDDVIEVVNNNETYHIENETKVLISEPHNIQHEVRCWVVDGKVVTASLYKLGSGRPRINYDDETAAIDFANKMVDIYQPARAFVLDICMVDNEYKILEINLINAAGFYAANIHKLVSALEDAFN